MEVKLENLKVKDYTITAKEARTNADCTPKVFSRIMKAINEASKEGLVLLSWGIEDTSEPLIKAVKSKLAELGYNVTFNTGTWNVPDTGDSFEVQTGLVIKW